MDEILRQRLRALVAVFGPSICADQRRCEGMLRNLFPRDAAPLNLLLQALEARVPADLHAAPESERELCARAMLLRLQSSGLSEAESRWAVCAWAEALGITTGLGSDGAGATSAPRTSRPAEESSPPQRVKTLYVGGFGGLCYASITEALEHAEPQSRILVRPGRYNESLCPEIPVEIAGDGPVEKIILQGFDGPALLLQTSGVVVRGLSIRAQDHYSVEILHGVSLLENCDITAGWFAAVAVHGAMARPTLRNCRIHAAQHRGLLLFNSAAGTIEDCDLFDNVHPNIVIETDANPILRRCRIYDSRSAGLQVSERGRGVVEECEIYANAAANVQIEGGGDPLIRECHISNGPQQGISCCDRARGRIEDCEIAAHGWSNVALEGGAETTFARCRIHSSQEAGVSIAQSASLLEDCELFGNAGPGVDLLRGGRLTLQGCRLSSGLGPGLRLHDSARALLEECDVFGNAGPGLELCGAEPPVLQGSRIYDNREIASSDNREITSSDSTDRASVETAGDEGALAHGETLIAPGPPATPLNQPVSQTP